MGGGQRVSGPLLPNWLVSRAVGSPDRLALICGEARWTFAELRRQADLAARRLSALGVKPADRVALLLPNGLDFVILVHASARLGAVLAPLNTRLASQEIAWQLHDLDPCLLLFDLERLPVADGLQQGPSTTRLLDVTDFGKVELADAPLCDTIDLSALANIIYTSGTTGRPKGAMLTYGNHWWNAIGSALNLGSQHDDCWLAALPLFHVGGLSVLLRSVIYGVPAIVNEAFDPARVNRAIDEESVTIVSVVATMLERMIEERGERPFPPTLRCVLLGGGPTPLPLLEAYVAGGVPVAQTYGLTEAASQVATLCPADAATKLGSAGRPLLPIELRIEGQDGPVGDGEVGEIVLRGPTVFSGYWNHPEETAHALRGGWLRTGDLGRLDADGCLYVADRRDDLIVSGGENVYPAEVEAVLMTHPKIAEAAVVAAPDQRWGQVPAAFVRARTDPTPLDEAEVIAFCRQRLAGYKTPSRVVMVDELPRNSAGKLLRAALRARLVGAHGVRPWATGTPP
jgi:O-succinylbenzoic acid--CoA ligase